LAPSRFITVAARASTSSIFAWSSGENSSLPFSFLIGLPSSIRFSSRHSPWMPLPLSIAAVGLGSKLSIALSPHSPDNALSFGAAYAIQI